MGGRGRRRGRGNPRGRGIVVFQRPIPVLATSLPTLWTMRKWAEIGRLNFLDLVRKSIYQIYMMRTCGEAVLMRMVGVAGVMRTVGTMRVVGVTSHLPPAPTRKLTRHFWMPPITRLLVLSVRPITASLAPSRPKTRP